MAAPRAFRQLLKSTVSVGAAPCSIQRNPIQLLGAVNPYCAQIAEKRGAKALYLSGSGVATASHGWPDLGIINSSDVVEDVRRITAVTQLPLLVDVDTGFGGAFGIHRTVQELERAGAAGFHIEDQVAAKRCGHRPGKAIVDTQEMVDRIASAVGGRSNPDFVIMARTDSFANEGLDAALKRCEKYIAAGADALFPEALTKLEEYVAFAKAFPETPILANITEFGKTPLYSVEELGAVGVSLVLYPLSAHRAMAKAADLVYSAILRDGHQKNVVDLMQTRNELYEMLDYHKYEQVLDDLQKQP